MAKLGKTEIDAQLDALRRLARDLVQATKAATPLTPKDLRALRRQQLQAAEAVDAEIDRLKQLKRRVLRARMPDKMLEALRP